MYSPMMKRTDFVALILTHGRAGRVDTHKSLRKCGYTGRIVFVVDNEDEQIDDYKRLYGDDNVVMFDKEEASKRMDVGDNSGDRRVILFARNESFNIARKLGYRYFLELDDDYTAWGYRYASTDGTPCERNVKRLDDLFDIMLDFLDCSGAMTIAFLQGGDAVGGRNNDILKNEKLKRKAMNTFFCDTQKEFAFRGRINEDVNTYVSLGSVGKLFFTIPQVCVHQRQTQANAGGMSETYLDGGTYKKSFYSVMMNPSCVKIAPMGNKYKRIHHSVEWEYAVPKILSETNKKT